MTDRRLAAAYRRASAALADLADAIDPAGGERSRRTSRLWEARNAALRAACEQLWQWLFREPFPPNVGVRWAPNARQWYGHATVGAIAPWVSGEMVVDWTLARKLDLPLMILTHEFAHLRGFPHGREMYEITAKWNASLGMPADKSALRD